MPSSLIDENLRQISLMAPRGYSVGLRIRFARPSFMRTTYDPAWTEYYHKSNLMICDPTLVWAMARAGTARWSDMKRDPFRVIEQAAAYGLKYGMTVSVGPLASRSVLSCSRDDREFTDSEIERVLLLTEHMHSALSLRSNILEGHIRILEYLDRGYKPAAIASLLGIDEAELASRLAVIRRRLGARSTEEALAIAKERRILSPMPLSLSTENAQDR